MGTSVFIVFFSVLVLVTGLYAFSRYRRFKRDEKLHRNLAEKLNLKLAYMSRRSFTIFGEYHGEQIRIESIERYDREKVSRLELIKLCITVKNPSLKIFRIQKPHLEIPQLDTIAPIDRPIMLSHDIGKWLDISTNDKNFAERMLSDDIKISIFEIFHKIDGALLSMYGEEICFYYPELLSDPSQITLIEKISDLLIELKEEIMDPA